MFTHFEYICSVNRFSIERVNIPKFKLCDESMNKIIVTKEQRERIKKAFGVVDDTVTRALNYKTNTDLSRKIRSYALSNGAKSTASMMLTLHDRTDEMTQVFSERVVIKVNKKSGDVQLLRNGEAITELKDATISDLMKLQERATHLAITL